MTSPAGILSLVAATRLRNKEQWHSPERLRDLRLRRLRRLVETAAQTAWYGDLFRQAGVALSDFADEAVLRRIPVLEKCTLRERGRGEMLTRPLESLSMLGTSGSTGQPLKLFRSARDQAEVSAIWARLWRAYGRRTFDRQVNIGSGLSPIKEGPVVTLRRLGLLPALRQIATFDPLDRQIEVLRELRPDILSGYSIALELVAEAVLATGVRDIRPRIVHSGSMVITERCRTLCRAAFGVAPLDVYASVECGPIAWQCPESGGMHLNDDVQIVEILDDRGRPVPDGELGNVVATQLICTAQPLLRYHTGDIAARLPGRCACGRGLGLLSPVQGRTQHAIRVGDGRVLTAATIGGIMHGVPQVRRYQVRQTGSEHLLVLVVADGEWTPGVEASIRQALHDCMGSRWRYQFAVVEDIPLAPSGKFQTVVPFEPSVEVAVGAAA
jgi:phenylacetate-CoA ligase